MIDRYYGYYTPTCDYCGATLPAGESFMEAVEIKKGAGWRARKDERGEWEDLCPECQQAEKEGRLTYADF